ncbi:MAG TPA: inorganic diphosphatase, partial [Candidatus Polarisedimenticolaceae bacterium]|nr:inorganic diphosphatase [Candidatus Polarisedimenticolaceae bacterium]
MPSAPVEVVIETPAGSRNKYLHDEDRGIFRLHKLLPLGTTFPFDFGFVPETLAEDGDPVDVLVLSAEPLFPGCRVDVRLLGVIEARQSEKGGKTIRNDRLIGVPETKKIRPRARTLGDLPEAVLDQLEHFFVSYNRAEGRTFMPLARRGPEVALRLVGKARRAYGSRATAEVPRSGRAGSRRKARAPSRS